MINKVPEGGGASVARETRGRNTILHIYTHYHICSWQVCDHTFIDGVCVIIVLEGNFLPFHVDLSPYRLISSLRKWLIN